MPTPTFLETLKTRMDEAQKRFVEAQQQLQLKQQEHQRCGQEFSSWQIAYQTELRNEQMRAEAVAATKSSGAKPPDAAIILAELQAHQPVIVSAKAHSETSEINKTALIRDVLRQHNGIRPIELWKTVKDQIPNRTYVYSVLKRLKDKDDPEVTVRKGKYYFRALPKVEEAAEVVH